MSGGTPAGSLRQRGNQGYASNGDDLDDDSCSSLASSSSSSPPLVRLPQTRLDVLANIVWLLSAAFIFYYGDGHQHFLRVLWSDSRIKRKDLYIGLVVSILDICLIIYNVVRAKVSKKPYDKYEVLHSMAPAVILLALISFFFLSYGLWPIWGFLVIPLLLTLLMTSIVVSTHLLLFGRRRSQSDTTRTD